jgi:deoxyribonuclease-4
MNGGAVAAAEFPRARAARFGYLLAMPRFGAHLSVAPLDLPGHRGRSPAAGRTVTGPAAALLRAGQLKCDCVQLFLRPNRQWAAPDLTPEQTAAFVVAAAGPIRPVVAHAAYLINLAGPPEARVARGRVADLSLAALKDELTRAVALGVPYVVVHAGNHLGLGEEAGLRRVVAALDEALDPWRDAPVTLLVENTAGQGTAVGWRLEQLAFILDHVAHRARVGLCVDTCHLFAAGYDLRTPEAYQTTIAEIDRLIGLARLHVWHLNDSLRELGSRVDRHTHIGRGAIGRQGFRLLVTDPRFTAHAMILETPKENDAGRPMDPTNLRLLRSLAGTA